MQSKFCKWLCDLSDVADVKGVKVEAKYIEALEYFYKSGMTPTEAFPRYEDVVLRVTSIQNSEF